MSEQNKSNQTHEETPKKGLGEPVTKPSSWKKLLSKRWVYPAVYVAAAAIILTLVWVYQNANQNSQALDPTNVSESVSNAGTEVGKSEKEDKSVPVIGSAENLAWPVADAKEVSIVRPYYDEKRTVEENEAAMVEYNDTFQPNIGIDLAREDNKPFEVKAALDGKVTRVEADQAVSGTIIEITHAGDVKTVYQSLTDPKVKQGDEVKQGDTIAMAGRNDFEKDLGNHLHFEVHEKDNLVNPQELLPNN